MPNIKATLNDTVSVCDVCFSSEDMPVVSLSASGSVAVVAAASLEDDIFTFPTETEYIGWFKNVLAMI